LSAIIIDANTSWSEATQQHYCGSTTKPRRYGRRSMAAKMASKAHKEAAAAYCKKPSIPHLKSQRDKDLGDKK